MPPERRTRFAPSPTGPLHLGHAYSAITAFERASPGQFLIRIEDLDTVRCKPEVEAAILDDLAWLGLAWRTPILRQSERADLYETALNKLISLDLCYPCRCSRSDIRAAASAPQEGAVREGPDGLIYPGTCRQRGMASADPKDAIRLDMAKAVHHLAGRLPGFRECGPIHRGRHDIGAAEMLQSVGDVVLSRRDGGAAYHLAVVVDDAAQAITEVTRGEDLFEATRIHVLLQTLLEYPIPTYFHHCLIRDESGKRLAKRDDARALSKYRAEGASAADIRKLIGLSTTTRATGSRFPRHP